MFLTCCILFVFFPLQNAICFIILTYLVPLLFTFSVKSVLKLKKNNFGSKRLTASCLSVCPYVHPHLTTRFPTGWIFMKLDIWVFFEKSVDKIQVPVKSDTNKAHFTCRPTDVYGKVSLQSTWNEKCFSQKLQRKSKHKFWCSVISFFFRKSCLLRDNMEKNFCRVGQAADNNMASARCMPGT